MYPDLDWTWLKILKARLERAIPRTGRKPVLITTQRLIDASLARLDAVDLEYVNSPPSVRRKHLQAIALRYRDGLLVAIATFFPLRRTNVSQFEIGTTIRRGPAGWSIHIPGELVKNGEPADAELEPWLSERIDRYVGVYRPLIFRSHSHKGFWASAKGCPAGGDALYVAFQKETRASVRLDLTLHDTRRIAATTWAVHDPVNAAGVKDLLGDRSDGVIAHHYNLASGIEASRKMANVVGKLKGNDPPQRR
jgi:integrase